MGDFEFLKNHRAIHRNSHIYTNVALEGLSILTGNDVTSYFRSTENYLTKSILVMFWSRFLDNGWTDFENVYSFAVAALRCGNNWQFSRFISPEPGDSERKLVSGWGLQNRKISPQPDGLWGASVSWLLLPQFCKGRFKCFISFSPGRQTCLLFDRKILL